MTTLKTPPQSHMQFNYFRQAQSSTTDNLVNSSGRTNRSIGDFRAPIKSRLPHGTKRGGWCPQSTKACIGRDLMGVFQIIGVPLRRLLHDDKLADAVVASAKDLPSLWAVYSQHSLPSLIWLGMSLFGMAFTLILLLAAITFLLPHRAFKEWQRRPLPEHHAIKGRANFLWMGALAVILLISTDVIWSNLSAFRLYDLSDRADRVLDELNASRNRMAGLASDTELFLTGAHAAMVEATKGGVQDLRPAIELARKFANQATEFAQFVRTNGTLLNQKLASHGVPADKVKDLVMTMNLIDTDGTLKELGGVGRRLSGLGGILAASASSALNSAQHGIASLTSLWPSFDHLRPTLQQLGDMLGREEVLRLCMVFLLISTLLCIAVSGFQFSRLRRFRIVWICMLILILVLSGIYLAHAYHLVGGTLMGAFCDAALSQNQQGGSIRVATLDNRVLLSGDLYAFAHQCKAGHDIPSALLAAFQSEAGSIVTLGNDIALDHQNQQITIKTALAGITLPVTAAGKTEYQKAASKAIDTLLETASPAMQGQVSKVMGSLDAASKALDATDFDAMLSGLRQLAVLLSTMGSFADALPDALQHHLQDFKVRAMTHVQNLQKTLEEVKEKAPTMSDSIGKVQSYVNSMGSAKAFADSLKGVMLADVNHFVANSLEPAMNCTAAGKAVSELYDTACGAGRAFQSLIVSLQMLIYCTLAAIMLHFFARKLAGSKTES